MNKLIFIGRFDTKDLEEINELLQDRYFGHVEAGEYFAELNEDVLRVEITTTKENLFVTVTPDGLRIESDNFFIMYDIAKIMVDNFNEDFAMRDMLSQ